MGDADSQPAADCDAERAGAAVALLGVATMVRITLMCYVYFYSLFQHEIDWEMQIGKASDTPPEPSLFGRVGL
ncbi:MAG: hypothetical protein ACI4UL_05440 [Muribaculaceae bacterium]